MGIGGISIVEDFVLELLVGLGCIVFSGTDIAPHQLDSDRTVYSHVVLPEVVPTLMSDLDHWIHSSGNFHP